MSEPDRYTDDLPAGQQVGRVEIVRTLTDAGVVDSARALDGEGDDLSLSEALAMMRLAEDTLIRERTRDTESTDDLAEELAGLRERVERIETLLGISEEP